MNRQLIIQAGAESDITDAALWYQEQREDLGEQFLAEVRTAIDQVLLNPRACTRLRRKPEVRRVLTRRFPYRIFFVVRPDALVVFRVLHAARHDREWKRVIPKN